jgi:hypothetical protein
MDLSIRTETFGQEDQSWLGSQHGTDMARSITLDTSAFTANTHYPNGYLLSGLPLGKITSSGKYGPYAGNAAEVQTVTITGGPTGGTFTLTFDGETTGAIAYNAAASAVQTALEGLSNVNTGDVTCAGGALPGAGVTVTFAGRFLGKNVPQMTAASGSLTGGTTPTASVATTTGGGSGSSDGTETLAGFLLGAVRVNTLDNTVDPQGALLIHGVVVASKLPIAVDAAGQANVAGRIYFA